MQRSKKIFVIIVCFVYLFSYIIHNFIIGIRAETTLQHTNIVAVFVDKDIYNDISSDVQRYASNYIQQRVSNSKATVFPINTDTFKAKDIVKILENLYFDGVHNQTSKLVGTILIGDIPLPVVNHDNFIFPSIYPYIDFEEQQYIYDTQTEFFTYNVNPNAQPEIWHGMINFKDELTAYSQYFTKLRTYATNPGSFVDAKIWYDDFTALKKYFISDNLQYYTNKHIFAEDAAYRRFSTFFLNILQGNRNQNIAGMGSKLSNDMASILNAPAEYVDNNVLAYNQALTNYGNTMNALFSDPANANILAVSADSPTFTKLLDNIIPEFLRGYNTLFGDIYTETMRNNIFAGGRRNGDNQIDTHIKKIMTKDDVMFRDISTGIKPTLMDFNTILEGTLNNKIQQQRYALRIPIPISYRWKKRTCGLIECGDEIDNYEFFFFGEKAVNISSLPQTHIYRGTYQNLSSIPTGGITTNVNKSVGGTYNIFSQQTEANRGYNFSNAQQEIDYRNTNRVQGRWKSTCTDSILLGLICIARSEIPETNNSSCVDINGNTIYQGTGKETPLDFAVRKRGGASPINLIENPNNQYDQILKIPGSFAYYKHAVEKIFDIAGSKAVPQQITDTNTLASIDKFGSMIQISDQVGPIQFPRCVNNIDMALLTDGFRTKPIAPSALVNFFGAFAMTVGHIQTALPGAIILDRPQSVGGIGSAVSRRWIFKTIDTLSYHTSPTPAQVNNMNTTTRDRPIDNIRKVSFIGLGGQTVELDYPNLYNVPVYTQTGSQLRLMQPTAIADSIKTHLRSYVQQYNQILQSQLNARMAYYNTNPAAFNLLAQHNQRATPNRSYSLIDEDIFINALGENTIQEIAQLLYYHNLPRQEKRIEDTIASDMQQHFDTIDINQKISHVMETYLVANNPSSPLQNPGYVSNGYEVAYINSDGIHTIDNGAVPGFIRNIQNIQSNFASQKKPQASKAYDQMREDEEKEQRECSYDPLSPVPLVQRPGAVACWARQLAKKPFNLTIKVPDYKSFGNEFLQQFENYSDTMNDYSRQRSSAVQLEQQNQQTINNLPLSQQQNLQDIMQYTITDSNLTAWYVDPDQEQEKYLRIVGTRNVGNIVVTVSATGDNCLIVQASGNNSSNNLCTNPLNITKNFFENSTILPVRLGDTTQPHSTKAGLTTVIFRICSAQNTQACIYKTQPINILPGTVRNLEISAQNGIIRGDRTPIIVFARDRFNNDLGLGLQEFTLSASTGLLFDGNKSSSQISFTDFRKGQFAYDAPGDINIAHNTPSTLVISPNAGGQPFAAKEILIKQPVAQITTNAAPLNSIVYTLPNTLDAIKTVNSGGIEQINLSAIPSFTLSLKDLDGVNLSTYVRISSSNNLLQPSVSDSRFVLVNGTQTTQTILKPQNSFFVDNGTLTVYLEPTYKAGEDVLTITIPGLDPILIPITINPGSARRTVIDSIPAFGGPGSTFNSRLSVFDIWGNVVTSATEIELGSIGALTVNGQKLTTVNVVGGVMPINIQATDPGGISYVYAFVKNVTLSQQIPGYARMAVQRDVLPREGLNVMYLNLFGNDWGNQWGYFSDIDASYINDRIKNSPKLLTTTTQLINPDKLKETSFIVTPSLKIRNLDNNAVSLLTEPGAGIDMAVGYFARIRIGEPNTFSLQQINALNNLTVSSINTNTIIYIPQSTDSIISSNSVQGTSIQINGNIVFDTNTLNNNLKISLSQDLYQGYPLWNVSYNNRQVGQMIIKRNDQTILSQAGSRTLIQDIDAISMHIIFAEGSTNGEQGIALTKNMSFFNQDNSYTSIDESNDETLAVGFKAPFKNITHFAAGQSVGEATKGFASMFMINIGDPLVKRIDLNKVSANSQFDTGIGNRIYSDPGKTIFKAIPFDFNNDEQDDILIAHTDGSIKLLKNYGGTDPYKDMGNLLLISDTIKDMFVGDVDGNNYPDILIWTNNNQLRVYHNNQGIFDVDGKLVCLDIALGPDTLDGVTQLFIEDMDQDGLIDIVTNDRNGAIKIFYGGSSSAGGNYVSTLSYTCDDQRQQRQQDNSILVKQYGVQLYPNTRIVDNSLVHRNGLAMPPEDDDNNPLGATLPDIGGNSIDVAINQLAALYSGEIIDTETFQTNMATLMQSQGPLSAINDLDIDALVQAGGEQLLRHTRNPFAIYPSYETLPREQIAYIALPYLASSDPVRSYKTYTDINGGVLLEDDEVIVTVHIEASTNTTVSFADQIRGPWIIGKREDGSLIDFNQGNLPSKSEIIWNTDNSSFAYMIDNIPIQSGQIISFSYRVKYTGGTPMLIDVKDKKNPNANINDQYPDIIVTPSDSCAKFSWTFFNSVSTTQNYRSYTEIFDNLWEDISNYYDELTSNLDDNLDEVINSVADVGNSLGSDIVQSLVNQGWDPQSLLNNVSIGNPINLNASINMTFVDDALSNVSAAIDTALQGLCQGFKLGGGNPCIQPPIPFNMSFLTPGTFNIFGCTLFQDKGLPLFFFPGTVYVMGAPIPMPYGLTQPGTDSFYWAPGGALPSMIRLYVSPTLTAQLGFAICLGPQVATQPLPQPIRDLGGNCIVLSLAIPCGKPSPQVGPNEVYTQQIDERRIDAGQGGTCTQPTIAYTESISNNGVITNTNYASSPFKPVAQDPFVPSPTAIIPQNTYGFGLINLDTEPVFVDSSIPGFEDFVGGLKLKAGSKINLKILGGMAMGLVKCIIQDWMDRQVKYIINNMSQMTIGIYFPNMDNIFAGLDSINAERLNAIFSQDASLENINTNSSVDMRGLDKISNRSQNNLLQQGELANASASITNPFELVGQMFEQVNLVNIANKDIILPIPFIYAEDVIKYSSYLETWIEANGKIFDERKNITKSAIGICSNSTISDSQRSTTEGKEASVVTARQYIQQRRSALTTELNQAMAANNTNRAQEIRSELNQLQRCDTFTQNARFQQFLQIEKNYDVLIRGIKQNLKTLEQYQQFPLELYEWMHITDRYLTELSGFIGGFFGKISYWIGTNAKRFSQYVDAIVTLIGVIQTWQALIDLSVNWAQSCGTCSNDTYDYYSCSLAFLCPQLPILPIPPFKLPNIYLDMSRINIGMQILLPNFKFVPTSITLPRIPDLPRPPRLSFDVDIDFSPFRIVDLPLLPPPPSLPTLPPLLPQVQLDLPVLPPAPKIPAISPSIRATINAAEFIGKIMCIIKGKGIGLVAEDGVKSKVEQMTQRSWNVPFFDYINLTTLFRDPPMQGFDYQIDTFVNLQFNFNGVYDTINYIADLYSQNVISPFTQLIDKANEKVDEGTMIINNNIVTDFINNNIQNNINIDVNINNQDLLNWNDIQIPEADYAVVKESLLNDIHILDDYSINHNHAQQIGQITSLLKRDNDVSAHLAQLDLIHKEVQSVVSQKIQEIRDIQGQINNNYNGFLDRIKNDDIVLVTESSQERSRSLALFGVNAQTKELLSTTDNPLLTYLDVQEGLALGYKNALTSNDAVSLGMDAQQHNQQQRYFDNVLNTIAAGKKLLTSSSTDTIQSVPNRPSLIAQNNNMISTNSLPLIAQTPSISSSTTCTNCGGVPNTAAADMTQYVQGIWTLGNNGKLINVVGDSDFIQSIGKNYISHDMNDDASNDILMWDTQNIYIKYANQNSITSSDKTVYNNRYYVSSVLQSPDQLDDLTDNRGYISITSQGGFLSFTDTMKIKIYDRHREVKNFRMAGQGFDDISLSWTHSTFLGDNPDGYLIQLNHRVDTHHDKYRPLSFMSDALIARAYVLVLPQNATINSNDRIILPYNNNPALIRNLMGDEIVNVFYYDPNEPELSITLTELSRNWKYAQVSTLYNRSSNSNFAIYDRASPRSNQLVAGPQVIDDTIGPQPDISFTRNATSETISEGTDHVGYVSTDYSLDIKWTDNVSVAYNWIEDEVGNIVATYTGDITTITGLFFTGVSTHVYTIGAVDYNQNFNRTTISVSIDIPVIQIENAYRTGDNAGSIIASINNDMDEGLVSFERMRTNVRQTMSATQNTNTVTQFPLTVGQTIITGAVFDLSDDIGLYNLGGAEIATLNPYNGIITLNPTMAGLYSLGVDFVNHVPMIRVFDSQAGQYIFQIYYAPQIVYGNNPIQILNPDISLIPLGDGFDAFSNGRCVQQNNSCISYISPNGHIYVPTPYHTSLRGEVIFDTNYITYIVKDSQNTNLYSVRFVMQPLLGQ